MMKNSPASDTLTPYDGTLIPTESFAVTDTFLMINYSSPGESPPDQVTYQSYCPDTLFLSPWTLSSSTLSRVFQAFRLFVMKIMNFYAHCPDYILLHCCLIILVFHWLSLFYLQYHVLPSIRIIPPTALYVIFFCFEDFPSSSEFHQIGWHSYWSLVNYSLNLFCWELYCWLPLIWIYGWEQVFILWT